MSDGPRHRYGSARLPAPSRRDLLASAAGLAAGLAGCADVFGASNAGPDAPATPDPGPVSATDDTETDPPPATGTPEVNRTPYAVAAAWDVRRSLGDGDAPRIALLATADWRARVDGNAMPERARSLLDATDFGTESVVALAVEVTQGHDRLVLESVDGVGTESVTLTVRVWDSGSGLQSAPLHLLAVRVPNRGTEPARAMASIDYDDGEGPVTVSTDG